MAYIKFYVAILYTHFGVFEHILLVERCYIVDICILVECCIYICSLRGYQRKYIEFVYVTLTRRRRKNCCRCQAGTSFVLFTTKKCTS